jgi:hypothetical protein
MTEDQRSEWKAAVAALHAQQRRQRHRPRHGLQAVSGVGMVRVLPPENERPAEAGRHTQDERYRVWRGLSSG